MRSKLLVTTAALLASVALASAQNVPGGGPSGGAAQSPGAPAAGQDRQSPQSNQAPRAQDKGAQDKGAPDKGKQGQAQGTPGQKEMRGQKDQTTGQAPRGQDDQKAQSQDGQKDKGKAQNQRGQKDQTTGQGQQPGQSPTQTQREQRDPAQGQSQQRQQPGQAQQPSGQGQPGQAAQGRSGSSVTLTTEQRTRIRETVLVGGNAPRVTNVNFSINVGTTVPRTVRVVAVPAPLIEIYPEWRGHMYFVVGDEIIIVDNNHRIIAVIAI
jgi:Protein of unknown function (DUF1236)